MTDSTGNGGWDASAAAWITDMETGGDFGRLHIVDGPMIARVVGRGFRTALDIGCGEGRFCRTLRQLGITATGIDPTAALVAEARRRDPIGDYRIGRAELLDFPDAGFDLVICYLSLIDIPDIEAAIGEMARVMASGATLLIANLASFHTAKAGSPVQNYFDEFAAWEEWRGIRVENWHRPMSRYMSLLLSAGLVLRYFDEPAPTGGDPAQIARYLRRPYYQIMEWQKPGA